MEQKNKSNFFAISLAAITVLMLLSMVFSGCVNNAQSPSSEQAIAPSQGQPSEPSPSKAKPVEPRVESASNKSGIDKINETIALAIADGTYVDNVTYESPGGLDVMQVSITVKDDVITSASLDPIKLADISVGFVDNVNAQLPGLVVGKKITEVSLTKQVAGSSLTTAAFNKHISELISKY